MRNEIKFNKPKLQQIDRSLASQVSLLLNNREIVTIALLAQNRRKFAVLPPTVNIPSVFQAGAYPLIVN